MVSTEIRQKFSGKFHFDREEILAKQNEGKKKLEICLKYVNTETLALEIHSLS